jgi:glycosyltransferase involved in cell wall biosynthesis
MKTIEKIKLIFIVTQSEFGGAQRYVFELISGLSKQKYDILVAAGQGNGEIFEKLKTLEIKTIRLKYLKRSPHPLQILFSMSEILDLLKKQRPSIVFLCSSTAGIIGSCVSYLYKKIGKSNVRIIYRIGGWAFHDPRNWFLNQLILTAEKMTAGFKDTIIVNSEFDRQAAIKNKICMPEKIVKIHNGINAESLNFLSKQEAKKSLAGKIPGYNIKNAKYTIGTIANLYRTKGLNHLIEAIALLESKYGPLGAKCIVIGEGKQRPKLEKIIKKHRLKNSVFLAGRIIDAFKCLKAFDAFVLPSLKEGFPWVILEAMAAEIPIIATRVGALPEIIENNKYGILIEPKNNLALAEKILWLLNNPKQAEQMALDAREKLYQEFAVEKMIEQTEKLLNSQLPPI